MITEQANQQHNQMPPMDEPTVLIRLPEVRRRTALSRSEIYRKMAAGEFPKQVHITTRTIAWVEAEVEAFTRKIIAERGHHA